MAPLMTSQLRQNAVGQSRSTHRRGPVETTDLRRHELETAIAGACVSRVKRTSNDDVLPTPSAGRIFLKLRRQLAQKVDKERHLI